MATAELPPQKRDQTVVEFDVRTDEMLVNMGPQHPSTHGVLRLVLRTDGEIVSEVTPHLGYLHRCAEKIGENVTPIQYIPYTDRMDYLAGMNMNLGYSLAIEKLCGMKIPEKAQVIRVLIGELNRVASHLVGMGAYGLDLGTFSPFLYAFREREMILDLFEEVGDACHRFYVRMLELVQSIHIVEQALRRYPTAQGSHRIEPPRHLPGGEAYLETEAPRGQMGFYVVGRNTKDPVPLRVRARSSCFCNLSVTNAICRGCLIADIPAIVGSLDFVMGEVDR